MQAAETQILPLLNGKKQFIIPIYQRTYSWTRTQCEQLWNDIVRVAQDKEANSHFVGSVVYIQHGIVAIPQLLVIDGQQRLTTITLLLLALAQTAQHTETASEVSLEEIYDDYLINKHGKGDLRYKLLLTQSDRDILIKLIDTPDLMHDLKKNHRLLENYLFFEERIQQSSITLSSIALGIGKLSIVEIALGKDDNPQLIFESLNSTGMDLSQADLIRNYVLMALPPEKQELLYKNYWYPMEQFFDGTDGIKLFDRFMRDYLTIKQGTIPNIDQVYATFKGYHRSKPGLSIEELVKDIYRYARHFTCIALGNETDVNIKRALRRINALKVDVAYPFLLEVYDDYAHKLLAKDDFLTIIKLIESYVFRRAICGIPTNALNKVFVTLAREIDKQYYLESVKAAFLTRTTSARFPSDEEFREAFVIRDVYNFPRRSYLFENLENFGRKEHVYTDEYTIEHIMPRNPKLSWEWQQELGPNWKEVQQRYLHTIGNLTLTGYNSEYSDKMFSEKRTLPDKGFDYSPLHLNENLRNLEHWNEEEIKRRAQHLADIAVKVWSAPQVSTEYAQQFSKPAKVSVQIDTLDISKHPLLNGIPDNIYTLFEQLRKRILNLDESVQEEYKKLYIAYKTDTNFVDITPQKKALRIWLNIPFAKISDPKHLCHDVTNVGHHGNGDIELSMTSLEQINDVMDLIRQSFELHQEDTL